jgi:hypothetical protein
MIDLICDLEDNLKEKLLISPVVVDSFDTKYPDEMRVIAKTLERMRRFALKQPEGIKSIYFIEYLEAFNELVSERLLKRYFATVFTLDVVDLNPTDELDHH